MTARSASDSSGRTCRIRSASFDRSGSLARGSRNSGRIVASICTEPPSAGASMSTNSARAAAPVWVSSSSNWSTTTSSLHWLSALAAIRRSVATALSPSWSSSVRSGSHVERDPAVPGWRRPSRAPGSRPGRCPARSAASSTSSVHRQCAAELRRGQETTFRIRTGRRWPGSPVWSAPATAAVRRSAWSRATGRRRHGARRGRTSADRDTATGRRTSLVRRRHR